MQQNRKQKKWFLMGILIVAGLLTGAAGSSFLGKKSAQPLFCVTVRASACTGQGVVYRQQEEMFYIVTAGHVVDGLLEGQGCRIEYGESGEGEARVLYRSETADLAFLAMPAGEETKLQAVVVSREHFDALTRGDRLWAAAWADGAMQKTEGELLDFWVYLEDFSLNMMLAKMDCYAGMSGCAILEENEYFTGILCGVSEAGEAAVLPYSIIESEWIQMVERGILK